MTSECFTGVPNGDEFAGYEEIPLVPTAIVLTDDYVINLCNHYGVVVSIPGHTTFSAPLQRMKELFAEIQASALLAVADQWDAHFRHDTSDEVMERVGNIARAIRESFPGEFPLPRCSKCGRLLHTGAC